MLVIVKNPTQIIQIIEELSVNIYPGASIELMEKADNNLSYILSAYSLIKKIADGKLIINNGIQDLDSLSALRYLYSQSTIPTDRSGKLRVHETPRKLGLKTCWLGCGDNPNNPSSVGNGEDINIYHKIGDSTSFTKYIDFNCIQNETFIFSGNIIYDNCKGDKITIDIVPRVVSYVSDNNTDFMLYNNYLIVPANGNGNVSITSDISMSTGGLVYMPDSDLGISPVAFWKADWDSINKKFINITPAPSGDGRFNMFAVEVILSRFINNAIFYGSGVFDLNSRDIEQLGHGMRMKLTALTNIIDNDHEWSLSGLLMAFRQKTI